MVILEYQIIQGLPSFKYITSHEACSHLHHRSKGKKWWRWMIKYFRLLELRNVTFAYISLPRSFHMAQKFKAGKNVSISNGNVVYFIVTKNDFCYIYMFLFVDVINIILISIQLLIFFYWVVVFLIIFVVFSMIFYCLLIINVYFLLNIIHFMFLLRFKSAG